MPRFARSFLPTVALLAMATLSACADYPAQQMYDARQAIRAAEKAGATQHAPEQFAEAKSHLKTAETKLHSHEYRAARDEAAQAREKAMEARRLAEAATAAAPKP